MNVSSKGLIGNEWTFETFCRDGTETCAGRIGMTGASEIIMIIEIMSS